MMPGMQRQFVFGGIRIGMYQPIRELITGPLPPGVNPTVFQKIIAGMATGAIGITVGNPTDVVKVKMQGQGVDVLEGRPKKYSGTLDCYMKCYQEGGIGKLWTGWSPNVVRNSVMNAAELAAYD